MTKKKNTKTKRGDYAPHIPPTFAPACEAPGCGEPGVYKAPQSPTEPHQYRWLCLDHVREHNQKWDFFAGMSRDEIEHFMRDAVTGHRPTWSRESRIRQQHQKLQDALYEFLEPGRKAPRPAPPISGKLRKALAVMDMNYPYTARDLKARYRLLVKKHHPDVNRGNKASEEAFKKIAVAYHTLQEHLKT